jgi:heme A synthase
MNNSAAAGTALQIERANLWTFGYAAALVVCILGLIVLGAVVTTEIQPVPGSPPSSLAVQAEVPLEHVHMVAALSIGVLIFGFGIWLQMTEGRAWLRGLAWAAFAIVLLEGWQGMGRQLSRPGAFFHAVFAQALLSIFVVLAVGVFGESDRHNLVDDCRISLRKLSLVTAALAFLQVLLGATYRHSLMGVMMHILNAMLVVVAVLVLSMLMVRQYPEHPALRPAAIALGVVTGVQVALGFATFIILILGTEGAPLVFLSAAHVATGALTLAASVMLAVQTQRYIRPAGLRAAA